MKRHTLLVFPCLALLAACEALGPLGEVLRASDKPTASVKGVSIEDLSLESLTLLLDVEVANPYAVELPVFLLDYKLGSGGTALSGGEVSPPAPLKASGKSRVPVSVEVAFADVLAMLSDVRPGQVVPYDIELGLSFDAPIVGALRLPLRHEGELPIPAVPSVSLTGLEWQSLSLDTAKAVLSLEIVNGNEFPLDLERLAMGLSLNGTSVVSTTLSQGVSLGTGKAARLSVPISFSPKSLGLAAFKMLGGDGASYALDGDLSVGSPFGPLDMPFSSAGKATFTR